ncbi:uncharacterized protein A4U43_C04F29710 [Asparagus officinalis]|uniref:Uncharacterized protein n=1 Tax=Asparagus officinalis TaxID=4686 RepID=A0A5P1F9W6_ASPOF|nr:uncharacterized protein A4U43_C04F29710 [Asparagus officinalis]
MARAARWSSCEAAIGLSRRGGRGGWGAGRARCTATRSSSAVAQAASRAAVDDARYLEELIQFAEDVREWQ